MERSRSWTFPARRSRSRSTASRGNHTLTDDTRVLNSSGKDLAARSSKDFKEGNAIMVAPIRDGNQLRVIALGDRQGGNQPARRNDGKPVSPDTKSLKPLNELGTAKYQVSRAAFIRAGPKRTAEGNTKRRDSSWRSRCNRSTFKVSLIRAEIIVLLSIGMSNTSQSSQGFQRALSEASNLNPRVQFVNGAQGGMTAFAIQEPERRSHRQTLLGQPSMIELREAPRLARAGSGRLDQAS